MQNDKKQIKKLTLGKFFLSIIGIFYIWSLPLLAHLGFAEKNKESISGYISNPQATGAMAVVSYLPITLMWQYQAIYMKTFKSKGSGKHLLKRTLILFNISYGAFLICSVSYVPLWLHIITVIIFCASYIIHCIYINKYININKITKIILLIGIVAGISLLFVKNMWFWVCECIGFTSMLLYTPIDWLLLQYNHEINKIKEIKISPSQETNVSNDLNMDAKN